LSGVNLTDLKKELPEEIKSLIGGDFDIGYNNLTSLEGSPRFVSGKFLCNRNPNLTSLKGCPEIIVGDLNIEHTGIETFELMNNFTNSNEYSHAFYLIIAASIVGLSKFFFLLCLNK
jgi:hypothetical protein